MSAIYDFPVGRGRQFGAHLSRALDAGIGGWTVIAIGTFQTGISVALTAPNLTGAAMLRNGRIGRAAEQPRRQVARQWPETVDANCFSLPASGFFGTSGWNVLSGPRVNNWNVGIQKYFSVTEGVRFQFRAEMFNAFNYAQFALPDGNVADAGFGLVGGATSPRLIRFALKLLY